MFPERSDFLCFIELLVFWWWCFFLMCVYLFWGFFVCFVLMKTLLCLYRVRGGYQKKNKIKTACIVTSCLLNFSSVPEKKSHLLYIISSVLLQQSYMLQAKSLPPHPWETIPQSNKAHSRMLIFFFFIVFQLIF